MTKKKAPGQPLPPQTVRPLLVPADEPIEALPTTHGLMALLYPPARGICTKCKKPAERLTQTGRHCTTCAAQEAA